MRTFIFFITITLKFTYLVSQSCDEMLLSAQSSERKGDYFDAYKKYDAAINYCNENKKEGIEKKKENMVKQLEKQRLIAIRAEEDQSKALTALRLEKNRSDTAYYKIELQRQEAILLSEQLKNLLDSLGMFTNREAALKLFNKYKENADTYFVNEMWDTAYSCYRLAINIADENPLIKVGKNEIYDKIEKCNEKIRYKNEIKKQIDLCDSLMKTNKFDDYKLSLNVLFSIQNKYDISIEQNLIKLTHFLDLYLKSKDTLQLSRGERIAFEYFLLEVYAEYQSKPFLNLKASEFKKKFLRRRTDILGIIDYFNIEIRHQELIGLLVPSKPLMNLNYIKGFGSFYDVGLNREYSVKYSGGGSAGFNVNNFLVSQKRSRRLLDNYRLSITESLFYSVNTVFYNHNTKGDFVYSNTLHPFTIVGVDKKTKLLNNCFSIGYNFGVEKLNSPISFNKNTFIMNVGLQINYSQSSIFSQQLITYVDTTSINMVEQVISFYNPVEIDYRPKNISLGSYIEILVGFKDLISKASFQGSGAYSSVGIRFSSDIGFVRLNKNIIEKNLEKQYDIIIPNRINNIELVYISSPFAKHSPLRNPKRSFKDPSFY